MNQQPEEWMPDPPVRQGDRVYVARHKEFLEDTIEGNRSVGLVTHVSGPTVDIITFGSGAGAGRPWLSCRHADDPVVELRPALFEDVHFGVFKLAPSETAAHDLGVALTARIDELFKRVEAIGSAGYAAPATPADKPKRGPGRPRKQKPALEEALQP